MVIDELSSEWAPVTGGIPQGSVLGPVLFIIYMTNVGVRINILISKFTDEKD